MAKVVAFEIEIKGQKDVVSTTKLLGLMNTQLILISNTLKVLNKQGGVGLKELNKEFKKTGSSAKQLGTTVKTSFDTFKKGNKVVRDLGNGYFEVTKQVDKAGKELKDLDKALETDSASVKELVERNKDLKKVLEAQPLDKQTAEIKKLGKEYSENNKEITKFRKELKTGIKASEQAANSINGLKNKSKQLTIEYNSMSASQRKFTKEGRALGKSILRTNKRLRTLQRRLKGTNSLSKTLSRTFTKLFVGRSILAGAGQLIGNLVGGLKEMATGTEEAQKQFADLNQSGDRLTSSLRQVGKGILTSFGGSISKIINNVAFAIKVVGDAFVSASEGTGFFANVLKGVGNLLTNFPAIFGGVASVIGLFRDTFVNSITEIKLNTELLIATVKRLGVALTGGDTSKIEKNIERINEALEKNVVFAQNIGEAYTEGYNATLEAQAEFNASADEEIIQQEKIEAQAKKNEEAKTARAAARKKRIEDEKKDRAELLKQIQSESLARIEIVTDLAKQLRDLEIAAIKDTTQQALAAEQERFEQEKRLREKNFNERLAITAQQEARIVELFGSKSKELADFINKTDEELRQLSAINDKIAERQEQQHQDALLQIQKDADETALQVQKEADEKSLAATIERRKTTREKLRALRQKRIDDEKAQEEEAATARKERDEATKGALIDLVNASISAISDLSALAFESEQRRFDAAIEVRQANIANLNDDLKDATGLQKKFLEIQVENEQKALEEETAAKEKARKEQGETQKAIAIVQAVIAAALSIANAFTLPPPASFVAAAATAVATAAQIAVIASQQFAEGGILQGPSHAQGGIQTSLGNLEGGEAVINKVSTAKFAPLLSQINVAGGGKRFADGGILGSPISAPNVGSASTDVNNSFNQFLQASMATTAAINGRVDRLQVNLDLNNLEDVQDNDSNLDALTTF